MHDVSFVLVADPEDCFWRSNVSSSCVCVLRTASRLSIGSAHPLYMNIVSVKGIGEQALGTG